MNISFRKSIRKSSRSSTFYLESFEMFDRKLNPTIQDENDLKLNSLPVIDFRKNEFIIPIKPITSVIKYEFKSERTQGTIGQIIMTNFRLKFIPYSREKIKNDINNHNYKEESDLNGDQFISNPPFELFFHNSDTDNDEDIEFLNIFDVFVQNNLLQIYCSDFRCIEFQFRSSNLVKSLADQLEKLIIKPSSNFNQGLNLPQSISSLSNSITNIAANRNFELSYFWAAIALQYSFNYPKDWEASEGYWFSKNKLLRISQANENYQLCKSLPISFITLKYYLTDINLLQNISAKMKGQRVPVITYSHKCKTRIVSPNIHREKNYADLERDHMLLRSGLMNKECTFSLLQAISPLNIIDVNELLPDENSFVLIYLKLREACFSYSNTNNFFTLIGKWMKLVCKVLSVVNDLSKILDEESSLLLVENDDNHWNIILSCLIQITLDKKRRTIEGFNSLISKEWLYMIGVHNNAKLDHSKLPNQILFTLFLDCVYQMLYQNSSNFEFTSLYLIRCFDLSFIPFSAFLKFSSKIESKNSDNDSSSSSRNNVIFNLNYHNSKITGISSVFKNLNLSQIMFYYNPFYNDEQINFKLKISSSILVVNFWRPLYLRWVKPFQKLNYYNQLSFKEYYYFKELLFSNLNTKKNDILIESEDIENYCSIHNDNLEDKFEHF